MRIASDGDFFCGKNSSFKLMRDMGKGRWLMNEGLSGQGELCCAETRKGQHPQGCHPEAVVYSTVRTLNFCTGCGGLHSCSDYADCGECPGNRSVCLSNFKGLHIGQCWKCKVKKQLG